MYLTDPLHDHNCEADSGKEVPSGFVVVGSNRSPILKPVERPLDQATDFAGPGVEYGLDQTPGYWRDHRFHILGCQDVVNIVGLVGDQASRWKHRGRMPPSLILPARASVLYAARGGDAPLPARHGRCRRLPASVAVRRHGRLA